MAAGQLAGRGQAEDAGTDHGEIALSRGGRSSLPQRAHEHVVRVAQGELLPASRRRSYRERGLPSGGGLPCDRDTAPTTSSPPSTARNMSWLMSPTIQW